MSDSKLSAAVKLHQPEWGIVLGSGLGEVVGRIEVVERIHYADIPGLPRVGVAGHTGAFVVGKLAGEAVVVAQGRAHLYEGNSAGAVTAGIRFLAACGVQRVILTNAAGCLNTAMAPGEWMMISDHLNLTGTSPLVGGPRFIDMSEAYSPRLRALFRNAADKAQIPLHEGVYAGVIGPQYETAAEIRMLKTLGADAVGMSTVLETIQARALGMEVAGFSCLTNWAAGISPEPLSHQEVLRMGRTAAASFCGLLERVLQSWRHECA